MAALSMRQKIVLSCLGALLLLWAACRFSFARTFALYGRVSDNKIRISEIGNLPRMAGAYEKLVSDLESAKSRQAYNREAFFEEINVFCRENALQILHFHPEQRRRTQNFELIINRLEVQGDFKKMVQLGWYIEHERGLGHIASVSYKVVEDKRTGKTWLTGSFYIQNYHQDAAK
jgi:hypothetical protein